MTFILYLWLCRTYFSFGNKRKKMFFFVFLSLISYLCSPNEENAIYNNRYVMGSTYRTGCSEGHA